MSNGRAVPAVAVLLIGALPACSSIESAQDDEATLDFLVEVPEETTDGSATLAPSLAVQLGDDAGNELQIRQAEIVVREVEFRRSSPEDCVDAEDPAEEDGDPCAEFLVDPALLILPVEAGEGAAGTIVVPTGTYEALKFYLHTAEEGDTRVLDARPEVEGASVFVSGIFNGRAVSATFAPTGELDLVLDDPLELVRQGLGRVTLTADVSSWFRAADGSLVDPEAAAGDTALSREVRERILDSFSARSGL